LYLAINMVKISFRKILYLALMGLLASLIILPHSIAQTQTNLKDQIAQTPKKKEWAVIDGFRSAKFGMNEKEVLRAISKDFKISNDKVIRKFNSLEKTKALIIKVPNLTKHGETSDIVYILGYKSKKLITINIDWGKGVSNKFDPKKILAIGNGLRRYFAKKRFKEKGYTENKKLNDEQYMLFRGRDKLDRTILLRFNKPFPRKGNNFIEARNNVSMVLSYIQSQTAQDIFQGKKN
jgi:hypothetical protein